MTITSEQPKEGNFLAVWEYGDVIWAATFKWENGKLMIYNESKDLFESHITAILPENLSYIIK